MAEITFTVFTAAYNRAATLPRLCASLQAQTCRDFEWIIVDDGSTDGTKELVASWRTDFPLRYFWQENSGKHVAFNRAVRQAKGLWFLNLDSDDEAAPQALERFSGWRKDLPESVAAIASLCCDETGAVLGGEFPRSPLDSCRAELRYHYKVTGDKWLCHRTDVMRRFPFPEPPGLKFVQERTVLAAISRRYRTRYVNEKLKIVHRGPERLSDNLWRHPLGVALGQRSVLNHELAWFRHAPLHFLRTAANYTRLSLAGGESFAAQWHGLETNGARCLWLATLPLGFILRLRDTNGLNRGPAIR